MIIFSLLESKEEVASSSKMISDFFKSAQAIRILYFSPPESLLPRSPT